jgi:hypothetical protein
MPSTRTVSRSFAGGEISKEMFGRLDDAKFQLGAAQLRNFIVSPTGAALNRAGLAMVKETRDSGARKARLIPFTYALGQTMVIELGQFYARFHTMGANLLADLGSTSAPFTLLVNIVQQPGTRHPTLGGYTSGPAVCYTPGASVPNGTPVVFTGTLPAGLTAGVTYYVVGTFPYSLNPPPGGTSPGFSVAATIGGAAIQINDGSSYLVDAAFSSVYFVGNAVGVDQGGGVSKVYYCIKGGTGISITDPDYFTLMGTYPTTNAPYEVPTPYLAEDVKDIRFAQSGDVMTLVHPKYPPAELRRLGATQWTLTPISFAPPLSTPQSVAVAASPGFRAIISTISTANPALITTVSNHTLALGNGIYIDNLTATIGGVDTVMDGFYLVQSVPVDVSGNLIPNQLTVMDYSGNVLDSTGWSGYHATNGSKPITIQFGGKIFNIDSFYAVQAIASDGVSTSALSAPADVINNLNVSGSYNTISWAAVVGAQSYYVFKKFNGLYGYIGQTSDTQFVDNNIAPDLSITPGIPDAVFSSAGNYPGAVCYKDQRRFFAATTNAPQNVWATNSGTESMMNYSLPSLATDRLAFRVAALQQDAIQHLVPMAQLIMLTADTEFALIPVGSEAITPSSISTKPQSYIGASFVRPSIINTSMVYAAARGGHVREMGYAWTVSGYTTGDLSLRAAHLFDNLTIVDQAYSKSPKPIIWFVSSSGQLLGLTYIPEEQLGAWHHHDTDGSFESVCCVAEGAEDFLYAIVYRTINGQDVRYVERMASRVIDETDPSTWFFVDAGATQTFGAPVKTINGLTWLEGCTVAVLADGCVQGQKVVTGGSITLDHAAQVVTVGLPYVSDLETLPALLQIDGYGKGRTKNISRAWINVYQSSGILVGPSLDDLTEVAQRTTEPYGSAPALKSEELPVLDSPSWQDSGQIFIRQQNPLPLDVVGLTLEVSIGG